VVEFVDIAGLVEGAHKGEGLGNQFLAYVRECSLLVHVLRAFDDPNVARAGSVDPKNDYEAIKIELILKDLETLEKQEQPKAAKSKEADSFSEAIRKLKMGLNKGLEASQVGLTLEQRELVEPLSLLTFKPTIFVLNIAEQDYNKLDNIHAKLAGWNIIPICAQLEAELAELNEDERRQYLESVGVEESSLNKLIKQAYTELDLISFFSARENESRAWTAKYGTAAYEAAGIIHTDMREGFIRALVCPWEEFVGLGGWIGAKEAGTAREEGRNYIVEDGDVIDFRFSV
jgi:GTP-binding protein YchF